MHIYRKIIEMQRTFENGAKGAKGKALQGPGEEVCCRWESVAEKVFAMRIREPARGPKPTGSYKNTTLRFSLLHSCC